MLTDRQTIEAEWREAIRVLLPRQVVALLLAFEKPELTGTRLLFAELVTSPGQPGETTLHGDRDMLVPILEAEVERRMRKSAFGKGSGT